jgi:hypothetical protein
MYSAFRQEITVAEPQSTPKGAKVAYINGPIRLCLAKNKEPLKALWGCSSFDEAATRVNFDLSCPPNLEAFFEKIDQQIKTYLLEHSETFFKKQLTSEQMDQIYKPTVIKREGYDAQIRTKLNLTDDKVKCYDFDHNPIEVDKNNLKNASVVPIVHLKNLWFNNGSVGLVLELQSMMAKPYEADWVEMFKAAA